MTDADHKNISKPYNTIGVLLQLYNSLIHLKVANWSRLSPVPSNQPLQPF